MQLSAQNNLTSSPYSVYGLGDVFSRNQTKGLSMGDVKYGVGDRFYLNSANPASYSSLWAVQFEVAGLLNRTVSTSAFGDQTNDNGSLRYFGLGMPITSRLGLAIGALPYTALGFKIALGTDMTYPSDLVTRYDGEGGLNIVYAGGAYDVYRDSANILSVGVNVNYYFGNINQTAMNLLDQNGGALNTLVKSNYTISDISFDFGLMYKADITKWFSGQRKNKKVVTLGATYGMPDKLKTKFRDFAGSFVFANGIIRPIDTVYYDESVAQIYLPQKLGFGITFDMFNKNKKRRLVLSADYEQINWNALEIRNRNAGLQNSRQYSFGAEFTPNTDAFRKFLKLTRYRLGGYYKQTRLNINGQDIDSYAVTFGFGIPLVRSKSTYPIASSIDLAFEIGQRGQDDYNLIRETFFNIYIGLSLAPSFWDSWFKRRKIE